jgi:hypothetical protein
MNCSPPPAQPWDKQEAAIRDRDVVMSWAKLRRKREAAAEAAAAAQDAAQALAEAREVGASLFGGRREQFLHVALLAVAGMGTCIRRLPSQGARERPWNAHGPFDP